ncbi:MAG: EamA family transporter [Clostridiales bacterium]|nr:EamA family transporter [Clostridiales bacterium]
MLGAAAVVIWGVSGAFTRTLAERLGLFTSGALVNLLSGALICAASRLRHGSWGDMRALPRRYVFVCGALYVFYVLSSYVSTAVAQTRQQALAVGVIKFMWPVFAMLLTPLVLKKKASRWIWGSFALSASGAAAITVWGGGYGQDAAYILSDGFILPSALIALASAAAWALFSILTRKYMEHVRSDFDGVGYFMLAAGALMALALTFSPETGSELYSRGFSRESLGNSILNPIESGAELAFQILLSSLCATIFWNMSMRRGNVVLVVAIANMLPIISVLASALILGAKITLPVVAGSLLVTAGVFWGGHCLNTNPISKDG